jgi:hypothetical protein
VTGRSFDCERDLRDPHRAAFEMRKASDSPQPARRAGEARADPGLGVGARPAKGPLTQSCPAVSGGSNDPETQGVSAVPQSLFDGTWSDPGPRPSCWL